MQEEMQVVETLFLRKTMSYKVSEVADLWEHLKYWTTIPTPECIAV